MVEEKISRENIEALIKKLDSKLKEKTEIILIGGTALSLLNERNYSHDIDFCHPGQKSPGKFGQLVIESAKSVGINPKKIEMFNGLEMTFLNIPDFRERATAYRDIHLKHIALKIMNPLDIAMTKLHRGDPKDFEDIYILLKSGRISEGDLGARYMDILKYQGNSESMKNLIDGYKKFLKLYARQLKKLPKTKVLY